MSWDVGDSEFSLGHRGGQGLEMVDQYEGAFEVSIQNLHVL